MPHPLTPPPMIARSNTLPGQLSQQAGVAANAVAEGDLGAGFGRDDRLAAGALVAAPDAVDVGRRPRPDALEPGAAALADRMLQADVAEELSFVEAETVPLRALRVGGLADAVVEA